MLTLFLSLIALTAMGMFLFSRKREDYEFLTVDSGTGDLMIVDSKSGLEPLSGGGLQTTGNFNVKGALTTDGNLNVEGALTTDGNLNVKGALTTDGNLNVKGALTTVGKINGVNINSGGVNGVTIGSNKVNGVTLLDNQVNAAKLTGNQLCIGTTCLNEHHLKMLKGQQDVYITANGQGTNSGSIRVSGKYSDGNNIYFSKDKPGGHNGWRISEKWPY